MAHEVEGAHLLSFQAVWKCPSQEIYESHASRFQQRKTTRALQNKTKTNLRFVCAKSLQSHPTPCDPMDPMAPLSMGSSRQEYWSGLPRPSPGDLPHLEIKPVSLRPPALTGGSFTTQAKWKAHFRLRTIEFKDQKIECTNKTVLTSHYTTY